MRILLDTHAFLWFVLGDSKLSQLARQHIEDPAHEKLISPASYWEIAIKISRTTDQCQMHRWAHAAPLAVHH